MQIVVDGLITNYERRLPQPEDDLNRKKSKAARPAVVLLHGWGDSGQGLSGLADQLAGQYEVVSLDLPGFGGTAQPPAAWGLDDYAGFVGAFLKKTAIKPYAIIGHSNGGAIAVRGLARGDLRADKLVLLASAGLRSQLSGRRRVLRVLTKAGKLVTYPLPAAVKKRLRKQLYSTVGSDLLVAEHLQETFKKIVTDDIQADAARLSLPTLLVYGEDDAATPVQYGRVLHNLIGGSRLETVGEAGHFVHLDKLDIVGGLVRKFLA